MDQKMVHQHQVKEAQDKARGISADKAAEYLLVQRKQENAQTQCGNELRVNARWATEVDEELAIEQWLANDLLV